MIVNNREGLTIDERILLAEQTIEIIVKDKDSLRNDFETYKINHSNEHREIEGSFNKQALQNQRIENKIDQVLEKLSLHINGDKKIVKEKSSFAKEIREWSIFIIVILGAIVGGISFINSTTNKINHVQSTLQVKP
jgi:hypothetical protein